MLTNKNKRNLVPQICMSNLTVCKSYVAYGFLMAQRLKAGRDDCGKKTSPNAKCLPFPKITSLVAAQRAQRHVPDSITTLRLQLSVALAHALGHLPLLQLGKPKIKR